MKPKISIKVHLKELMFKLRKSKEDLVTKISCGGDNKTEQVMMVRKADIHNAKSQTFSHHT